MLRNFSHISAKSETAVVKADEGSAAVSHIHVICFIHHVFCVCICEMQSINMAALQRQCSELANCY